MTDYSQSGEQKHLERYAAELGRPGRFLDVGAFDGVTGSNSRALALTGWTGVCVEPAAKPFHDLALVYAERTDVSCVNALLGAPGLQRFFYSPTDLLSTTEEDHVELWRDDAPFVQTYVMGISWPELLEFAGDVDVVSIDTEGTAINLFAQLVEHPAWQNVGIAIVEFQDGQQEAEIHEIAGPGFAVLERTANNIVLRRCSCADRGHDWADLADPIGDHRYGCGRCGALRREAP